MPQPPNQARVVIVGGGVIGCSIAYHLAKQGWQDVVLLERKQLTSGTTWHAAGLIAQLRSTKNMTRLAKYSQELYFGLEEETGVATGFRRTGSITAALTDERHEELMRQASMARAFGVEIEDIGPDEIKSRYPHLNVEDVVGGVYLPKDGQGDPANIALSLAKGARANGAKILEGVKATGFERDGRRVTAVDWTSKDGSGRIAAEHVVNAAGMWGHAVGKMAGVNVPLQACEHFYIVTEAIPGLETLPVLRVPDECAYYKEDAGKILLGAFEPNAKPWGMDGIPEDFEFDQLPEDFDHFEPILEKAVNRMPVLAEAGIHTFFNGPESFTPDDAYHLGPAPEVDNFWWRQGSIPWVSSRQAAQAWRSLSGWRPEKNHLIWAMWTSRGWRSFRATRPTSMNAPPRRSGYFTPITFRFAKRPPRGACAAPRFMHNWRLKALFSESFPAGSARTGSPIRVRNAPITIPGSGPTGSTTRAQNTWRSAKAWASMTCLPLASFASKAPMQRPS